MPAITSILAVLNPILKAILFSWLGKLATAEFIEWILLWAAEQLVKSTKTPHDDLFLAKIEEALRKENSK